MLMNYYYFPGKGAMYCDKYVCLSVCLSLAYVENYTAELHEIFCA